MYHDDMFCCFLVLLSHLLCPSIHTSNYTCKALSIQTHAHSNVPHTPTSIATVSSVLALRIHETDLYFSDPTPATLDATLVANDIYVLLPIPDPHTTFRRTH